MAINKGFRPNPCLVRNCARTRKERTANILKRVPSPAQWNSQAIPQSSFATGQSGPGSAAAGGVMDWVEFVVVPNGGFDIVPVK